MYVFKKLVSRLLFPLPLCVELLVIGLVFLWFTKKQKTGKVLVTTGTALLLLFSCTAFSDLFLRPLETRYPALLPSAQLHSEPEWIAVLGQGYYPDPRLPPNAVINSTFLARLIEAARLHRLYPGAELLVSVSGPDATPTEKREWLDGFSAIIAMDSTRVRLITTARDTKDEVRLIRQTIGNQPFALVSV